MSPAPRLPAKLVSGNSHPALAEAVARELNMPIVAAEVTTFADGETRVHISLDMRDAAVFIMQPTRPPVNEEVVRILREFAPATQKAED